jgi:hypothetical protein
VSDCTLTGVRQIRSLVARAPTPASRRKRSCKLLQSAKQTARQSDTAGTSGAQTERMAARVQENDEVGRVIAAGGAAGTNGLGVRGSLVQIIHIKV